MWISFGLSGLFLLQPAAATPNDFFKRGTPTFIVGTAGDDLTDRAIRNQAAMLRDLLFPMAKIVSDSDIDPARGAAAWPANAIVYGGPHVNTLLAKLGGSLPFRLERGKLTIGKEVFEGDEYRLITVVPARGKTSDGPGYPEFLLYAGTASPGVGEINALRHGGEQILIGDVFGRLLAGTWQRMADGTIAAEFPQPRARRIVWRSVDRELKTAGTSKACTVHLRFPQMLPAASDEMQVVASCIRGLETAALKLEAAGTADISVFVYPDLGSIASITGQRGDGHAVVEARALHVVRFDPAAGGGFEKLLAHEGAHVLAYGTWGAAGTPLLGEGLAVWASEQYGSVSLSDWKRRLQLPVPPVANLLGKQFRQLPENQSYPLAGLFVQSLVDQLGIAKVRQHLYGATASTWDAACKEAGTTPRDLETAFQRSFGGP